MRDRRDRRDKRDRRDRRDRNEVKEPWIPKTELGREVLAGKIRLDEIFRAGRKIKETGIIDHLIPALRTEIIFTGSSPGKGGGSRKTPTRRTARMHSSGRRYKISALSVAGNENGYIGIGRSKAKDNMTAINKATEYAKLTMIPIKRGCGSWECGCGEKHSVPYTVEGKAGSLRIILIPAPKGIGLCINDEAKKMMKLAGIKDVWSKVIGETRTRINYMLAVFDALKKMNSMKTDIEDITEIPLIRKTMEAVPEIDKEIEITAEDIDKEFDKIEAESKEKKDSDEKKEEKKVEKKEAPIEKKEEKKEDSIEKKEKPKDEKKKTDVQSTSVESNIKNEK
ncbi:30S ribosomal protein S5 [Candidatus Aenigmatarchaeota archaeon]